MTELGMKERAISEVDEFCGWEQLRSWIDKASTQRRKGLILVLFKTGCRIREVLGTDRTDPLVRGQFEFGDDWVKAKNLPVLKRYTEVGKDTEKKRYECKHCPAVKDEKIVEECPSDEVETHEYKTIFPFSITEPKDVTRSAKWPASEELNGKLESFLNDFEDSDVLFPELDRHKAWYHLNEVSEDLWCHRLRGERASQLLEEYNFSLPVLKKWFSWKTSKVAENYIGTKKAEEQMMKKGSRDELLKVLGERYPELSEEELIETIETLRNREKR